MRKIILICLSFILSFTMWGQTLKNVTVSGIVNDETGQTMIGATISLKNKIDKSTFTDEDGLFTIKATEGDVLVVTMVGYKTYEYMIKDNISDLSIKMLPQEHELTETVITGLGGSQRKISIVGAVTTVDPAELQAPATSITNMLGGRVAGIITKQNSGEPGKNVAEFWIRGIGTFGANASALVLIDGLEGSLNNIDPADIESFSVLKDASATAVYGTRGANGVVLVTTKRGTTDKLTITGRANLAVSYLNRQPTYLNSSDYANLANEAKMVRGEVPLYNDAELFIIKNHLDPDLYPDVNWRDEILKDVSLQQTYYMSARGGGSVARYFLSLGMSIEDAAYKQDKNTKYKSNVGYNKYTYRTNIDMDITKTTKLYFGAEGAFTTHTIPGMGNTDEMWYAQLMLTPLTIPVMYSNGQFPGISGDYGQYSPYLLLNYTGQLQDERADNTATLALEQDLAFITKGLKIRAQGALNTETWTQDRRYLRPDLYRARTRFVNGQLDTRLIEKRKEMTFSNAQSQRRKIHFESTLNYETLFGEDHRFSGLVYYYMSDDKWGNALTSMGALPYRNQGISSRLSYGFKDTYLLDVNFGYTGSENFQKGQRFGFFPAIAGGWIPTGYNFMKENLPWLDFLKIRGSYGLVGNDRIVDNVRFPYLTNINGNAPAGWGYPGVGIEESYMGADNLEWEKAKKLDIGIEGQLFHQAVSFTLDYFNDQRDGIFVQRAQIPGYVGLTTMPYSNVGRMRSWGSDGNVTFSQKINKDWNFTVRGNFTYTRNDIQNWERALTKYPYQEWAGWPNGVRRGYIALGLFDSEDDIKNSPPQDLGGTKLLPGDIKYKDVNGDGVINSDDQVPISYSNNPTFMYGFGGEMNYKKFTFGFLFKGTGQTDFNWMQNANGLAYIPFSNEQFGNVLDIAMDPKNRWTPREYSGTADTENPNARFPRLSYGRNDNNNRESTFWKGDARYLRLSEVSLNYALQLQSLKSIGISKIDLQLAGFDLLVWDKVKLWDPELAGNVGRAYPIPSRVALQLYIYF